MEKPKPNILKKVPNYPAKRDNDGVLRNPDDSYRAIFNPTITDRSAENSYRIKMETLRKKIEEKKKLEGELPLFNERIILRALAIAKSTISVVVPQKEEIEDKIDDIQLFVTALEKIAVGERLFFPRKVMNDAKRAVVEINYLAKKKKFKVEFAYCDGEYGAIITRIAG